MTKQKFKFSPGDRFHVLGEKKSTGVVVHVATRRSENQPYYRVRFDEPWLSFGYLYCEVDMSKEMMVKIYA